MGMIEWLKTRVRGAQPTFVDYESYEQRATGTDGPLPPAADGPTVLGRVGPQVMAGNGGAPFTTGDAPSTWKLQQSYDSLLQTVSELRAALDGQAQRQGELLDRLSALPQAVEALPQTTKMQADMLKMINERLALHAQQQRKVSEVISSVGGTTATPAKKETLEKLDEIKEQIEMGNEIDRQLVESFNRFSMMIDRLQLANQHAVDALQQVRDSYAASSMQMHEWLEKSRARGNWLLVASFLMSATALGAVMLLVYNLMQSAAK